MVLLNRLTSGHSKEISSPILRAVLTAKTTILSSQRLRSLLSFSRFILGVSFRHNHSSTVSVYSIPIRCVADGEDGNKVCLNFFRCSGKVITGAKTPRRDIRMQGEVAIQGVLKECPENIYKFLS